MPRIHPREKKVTEAENKLRTAMAEALEGLTPFEALSVVGRVFGGEILGVCKYEIRRERHGDTETPGGWAPE